MVLRENYNRIIVQLTGVDSLVDDPAVDVMIFRGRDKVLVDAGGLKALPGGTQRIDTRWGSRYIRHTRGRIEKGVLLDRARRPAVSVGRVLHADRPVHVGRAVPPRADARGRRGPDGRLHRHRDLVHAHAAQLVGPLPELRQVLRALDLQGDAAARRREARSRDGREPRDLLGARREIRRGARAAVHRGRASPRSRPRNPASRIAACRRRDPPRKNWPRRAAARRRRQPPHCRAIH